MGDHEQSRPSIDATTGQPARPGWSRAFVVRVVALVAGHVLLPLVVLPKAHAFGVPAPALALLIVCQCTSAAVLVAAVRARRFTRPHEWLLLASTVIASLSVLAGAGLSLILT